MADRDRLIIFDMDGTLVDSEPIANAVLHRALRGVGVPISYEDTVERFVGRPIRDCLRMVHELYGVPLGDEFLHDLQRETYAAYETGLRPIPHAAELLAGLAEPFCLASSSSIEKIRLSLRLTGLDGFFEARTFSAEEVARGKPAPDLFLHAAARLGFATDACIVVEDSLPGIEAGRAAGMRVLAFTGGGHVAPARLRAAGGEPFDDLRQLPVLLGR
ncbi:HAD family hydrolase [Oceanibacterium hippocampi]|uniref:6-phosphogluconate phosphatase n=1 Tax=Oceanibacterium hippocampi TaxID=745714 RepID=A0A1Y5TVY7_9PROT|nr:HAD family hydrolase [Oceanibacterium hippocampi]SLN74317.1 6-phosphogluconate phosphatase [Oceanibacterium hippocampi]